MKTDDFNYYLPEELIAQRPLEKRDNSIEREYLYTDKQYAVVPNVVGMKVKEATNLLKEFKVEYTGSGEYISYQSPNAGETIYEGETVRLLLTEK